MNEMEQKLQEEARALLEQGKVDFSPQKACHLDSIFLKL